MQICKRALTILVTALSACLAWAVAPEAGKVYRIKNVGHATLYLQSNGAVNTPVCQALNQSNDNQLWLAGTISIDGAEYITLRNLGNGYYLNSSTSRSAGWNMEPNAEKSTSQFILTEQQTAGDYGIRGREQATNCQMHCDGQSNVVSWGTDTNNSHWQFFEVTDVNTGAILAKWNALDAEIAKIPQYQALLDQVFSDKACTQTKPLGQFDEVPADLPAELRNMWFKADTDLWGETCGAYTWDSTHAKKYRVQHYEPYSEGSAAASLAGIQAYTNMNNPTGIVADSGSLLYVMVNDEVPEGASLHIDGTAGDGMLNNAYAGYELHQGLNIIPCYDDNTSYFIFYTVNTAEKVDGKWRHTDHKVTAYAPIKIHIEGGRLNGYFDPHGDDLYMADKRDDFDYTSARATALMYDLKGKYVIQHFFLQDTPDKVGDANLSLGLKSSLDPNINTDTNGNKVYDPVVILKYWDEMCFAERILMGIQSDYDIAHPYAANNAGYYSGIQGDDVVDPGFDYSDYFNNRLLALNMQGHYMDATSWRTAFGPSTTAGITTLFPSGNIWGPAHEYGHVNQGPMKIAGTTEESNNIFSNVALFFHDHGTTSRSNFPSKQQEVFARGGTFLEHDTWGTTRMFWQLWLYYHACKNNTKFYPRLYELLRQQPLQKSYNLNPRYDLLHFAKMCCVAAQEDLTNFFTAWGFFEPTDNYHIGDYANYRATLTQEDIDAVKAEIAALNLPKNDAIILIDDRPGSEKLSHSEFNKELAGIYGGLADFVNSVTPAGSIEATVGEDGKLHFSVPQGSSPGVGFLLYDSEGNLLGFTNSNDMVLSTDALAKVVSGEAGVVAQPADPTEEVTPVDIELTPAMVRAALTPLLAKANLALNGSDPTGTHVGKFLPDYITDIQRRAAAAQAAFNDESASVEALQAAFNALYADYTALAGNRFARVAPIAGNKYQIISRKVEDGTNPELTDNGDGVLRKEVANSVSDNHLWVFEPVSLQYNTYYIRNAATGKYISRFSGDFGLTLTATAGDDNIYQLKSHDDPTYQGILEDSKEGAALNIHGGNGNLVTYGWNDVNSQWRIILAESNQLAEAEYDLDEVLRQADNLLKSAGSVTETATPFALTGSSFYSNAPDGTQDYNNLIDANGETIFHSNWHASAPDADPYLRINLGKGNEVKDFVINWQNRANGLEHIVRYNMQVSNNGSDFTTIATINEGLPTGGGALYTSPVFRQEIAHQYIRLEVTQAQHTNSNTADYHRPFFVLAELGISSVSPVVNPTEAYQGAETEMLALYYAAEAGKTLRNQPGITAEQVNSARASINLAIANLQAFKPSGSLGEAMRRANRLMAQVTSAAEGDCIDMNLNGDTFRTNAPYDPSDKTVHIAASNTTDTGNGRTYTQGSNSVLVTTKTQGNGTANNWGTNQGEDIMVYRGKNADGKIVLTSPNTAYYVSGYSFKVKMNAETAHDHYISANGDSQFQVTLEPSQTVTKTVEYGTEAHIDCFGTNISGIANGFVFSDFNVTLSIIPDNGDITGSLSVLTDKNDDGTPDTATYFHSNYADNNASTDNLSHYIVIPSPEGETFRNARLSYTMRNADNYASHIKAYSIAASYDGVFWTDCFGESGFDTAPGATHTSPEFIAPAGTRYLRFMVTQNGNSSGRVCFAISNLSVANKGDEVLTQEYPQLEPAMVNDLVEAMSSQNPAAINAACDVIEAAITPTAEGDPLALLIEATQALLDDTGEVNFEKVGAIELSADQLYSNAPYGASANPNDISTGDNIGKLLTDNNTWFHSDYTNTQSADGLHHYIRIQLVNPNMRYVEQVPVAASLTYITRGTGACYPPKTYEIHESSDMENWTGVMVSEGGLPTENNTAHESAPFLLKPTTQAVRMMVTETPQMALSAGHPYFAMKKIGLNEYTLAAEPNENYSEINTSAMTNAYVAIERAKTATADTHDDAQSNLQEAYDALVLARNTSTGIVTVSTAEMPASTAVYDLQGRRVANPGRGIYIINGRKIVR